MEDRQTHFHLDTLFIGLDQTELAIEHLQKCMDAGSFTCAASFRSINANYCHGPVTTWTSKLTFMWNRAIS